MSATANVTKVDFYEVLEVSRDANDQELKTSYRRLAMQYHPDRNPNNPEAEEQFKAVSTANDLLSDAEKRARDVPLFIEAVGSLDGYVNAGRKAERLGGGNQGRAPDREARVRLGDTKKRGSND